MKKPGKVAAMLTSALVSLAGGGRAGAAGIERAPVHAGSFYPAGKSEAEALLKGYLAKATPPPGPVPRAVVVPHAGWQYSGPTASWAYKALARGAETITRVILLAPSHYVAFRGVVVNERSYRSPLGVCPLDTEAIATLKKGDFAQADMQGPGTREHADEVQIPFIQTVLPKARLVPLIVGELAPGDAEHTARAISTILDEHTVIIASSDFTHYGLRFGFAPPLGRDIPAGLRDLDLGAADRITRGDGEGFAAYVDRTGATICGRNPISILLAVFKVNRWRANGKVLQYATSGALTGDWSSSVSYCAIALGDVSIPPRAKAVAATGTKTSAAPATTLSPADGEALLKLSRYVLRKFVVDKVSHFTEEELEPFGLTAAAKGQLGAFVTLREQGQLRGCIGHIVPRFPLYRGVVENTMNAASRDPRFGSVKPGELAAITIEISVMSPLVKVESVDEIVVGRDGLVLVNGQNTGVFLPQVPGEQGWDKDTFLQQLGVKAGLDPGAYRRPDTELYRFTARIFEEKP
ncbi:MAG: AmmeMemoRadiSam system protein B [Candidatus Coatesbacteria bacterium]